MIILVCGDRDWTDADFVFGILDSFLEESDEVSVVEGGCRGADNMAGEWALEQMRKGRAVTLQVFEPDWKQYGKAAGPVRNCRMLQEKPDFVLAFHDDLERSRGTRDMIKQAKKAGVPYLIRNHHMERDSK